MIKANRIKALEFEAEKRRQAITAKFDKLAAEFTRDELLSAARGDAEGLKEFAEKYDRLGIDEALELRFLIMSPEEKAAFERGMKDLNKVGIVKALELYQEATYPQVEIVPIEA